MSEAGDELDIALRSPDELLGRMVALLATSRREEMEYDSNEANDAYGAETDRFDLHAWLRSTFPHALTPVESRFVAAPIGTSSDDDIEHFLMDAESAVAVAWALGIECDDTLMGDHAARIERLRAMAPKPWDRPDKLRRRIEARSEESVWLAREGWYLRHVRILLEDVDAEGDRVEAIADVHADAIALGLPTEDGDILFGGQHLSRLDDEEFAMVTSMVDAWVRALTWACSLGGDWDDLDIDEID